MTVMAPAAAPDDTVVEQLPEAGNRRCPPRKGLSHPHELGPLTGRYELHTMNWTM